MRKQMNTTKGRTQSAAATKAALGRGLSWLCALGAVARASANSNPSIGVRYKS